MAICPGPPPPPRKWCHGCKWHRCGARALPCLIESNLIGFNEPSSQVNIDCGLSAPFQEGGTQCQITRWCNPPHNEVVTTPRGSRLSLWEPLFREVGFKNNSVVEGNPQRCTEWLCGSRQYCHHFNQHVLFCVWWHSDGPGSNQTLELSAFGRVGTIMWEKNYFLYLEFGDGKAVVFMSNQFIMLQDPF